MLPAYWSRAVDELAAADPVLAALMLQFPNASLASRGDAFSTLARSITGQQISVKASETIWQRLLAHCPVTPESIIMATPDTLRGCGFSGRKVEYLQDLARQFIDGQVQPAHWTEMDDESVIVELCRVRGIGRWTAEMFLMFNLLRPDVLPLDDIGLQNAVARHYAAGTPLSRAALREHAEVWRPWRSVATWYLWRSLDPHVVAY
jgi:DNA-3-methyladenine glycosylase II